MAHIKITICKQLAFSTKLTRHFKMTFKILLSCVITKWPKVHHINLRHVTITRYCITVLTKLFVQLFFSKCMCILSMENDTWHYCYLIQYKNTFWNVASVWMCHRLFILKNIIIHVIQSGWYFTNNVSYIISWAHKCS